MRPRENPWRVHDDAQDTREIRGDVTTPAVSTMRKSDRDGSRYRQHDHRRESTGGTSGTVKCDGGTQMDGASADARFTAKAKAKARAQEREENDMYF